jgi:hypothetical protein
MAFDIFISYRRDSGSAYAQLVYAALTLHGFSAFLDVRDLGSGPFDSALLNVIRATKDVIVIVTPESLKRCLSDDDWVRQEIIEAFQCGANVIPLLVNDAAIPSVEELPEAIAALSKQQAVRYDHELSDESLRRMMKLLRATPSMAIDVAAIQKLVAGGVVGSVIAEHTNPTNSGESANISTNLQAPVEPKRDKETPIL